MGPVFQRTARHRRLGITRSYGFFYDGQVTVAGAGNFFAVVKDAQTSKDHLLTALLGDKLILDGVTRHSVLELAKTILGDELQVLEEKYTISDLEAAWKEGRLMGAFVLAQP